MSEPERLYILGHYYRFVVGDFAKVVETYQTWKRVYPGSPVPPTNLASLYLKALGQYDAAVPEAREAVRLAPYSSVANGMLIRALLGTNQLAEARAALRAATGRGVRDLAIRLEAFDVAVLDGDAAAMQEQVDWAAGEPSAQVAMAVHSAMASASAGRLRASRREWSQAEQAAVNMGSPSRRLDVDITRAWTEALLGDARAARAGAEAAAAADRRPPSLLHAAMMLAFLGNASRADELIAEADPRSQGDFASQRVWLPVARALARAARGRPAEALDIISAAGPFERGRDYFLAPLGARGWIELRAGRPRDAAATFNDLLRLRTVLPTSPWVPYARLGLARALCEAGDVSASRTAYDSFLEAMSSADPDAPLLVAARRERAALRVR